MDKRRALLRAHRGFSLLELVVSILIISALMLWAYKSFEGLAEDVERVSFEGARNNIQAQVTLKVAYWFAEQHQVSQKELEQANPVDLIQHRPFNYAGEIGSEELADVAGEYWYFVSDKNWFVYKAKRASKIQNEFEQVDIIPFQLSAKFQQSNQDMGLAVEVKLIPVYKFYWQAD